MPSFTMRGQSAEVRAGHETAVSLGRWELVRTDEGFTLTAPCLSCNAYWLTAGYRLDLLVSVGRASWRWRNVEVSGDGPITVMGSGHPEVE